MEGQQMSLFSGNAALSMITTLAADDSYAEEMVDLDEACEIAAAYGRETARTCASYPMLCLRLREFAEQLAVANDFDADEQEIIGNTAFASADPVMLEKQH